jgi:hypothetical protein
MAVWVKCRPAPSSLPQTLLNRVAPPVPSKSLDDPGGVGQQGRMFHLPFHFVPDEPALNEALFPSSSSLARTAHESAL